MTILDVLREKVQNRIANNARTRELHPSEETRQAARYRMEAYAVVLSEIEGLQEVLQDLIE